MATPYEKDFHAWSLEQASLLKSGSFYKLDIDHLVEEIETLGSSDKNALQSHLAILLSHLLKIMYQPEKHTRSWDLSIKNAKFIISRLLKQNPSFKRLLPEFIQSSYQTAKWEASLQTDIDDKKFPKECPWCIDELLEMKDE